MTHYRLTIATERTATIFCIKADTDLDANRKAKAIAHRLNVRSAKIQLTMRTYRVADRLAARLSEPRVPTYWGA